MAKTCGVVINKAPRVTCGAVKNDRHVMCAVHWRTVPRALQSRIWSLYRRAWGSTAHVDAVQAALEHASAVARMDVERATPDGQADAMDRASVEGTAIGS